LNLKRACNREVSFDLEAAGLVRRVVKPIDIRINDMAAALMAGAELTTAQAGRIEDCQ
jgi:hypothetical protein